MYDFPDTHRLIKSTLKSQTLSLKKIRLES